jgi:hypothetical protein
MATPPDFTTGQVLTAAQMNAVGLWLIDEVALTTVTNNISNVFSSDFNAYKIVVSNLNNATTSTRLVSLRFRNASGNDSDANYFFGYNLHYGGTSATSAASGQTSSELAYIGDSANDCGAITMDIMNPFLSTVATVYWYTAITWQPNVSAFVIRNGGGGIAETTSYTGFSIIGTTDNLSGTVRVYGYRN